MYSLLALGEAVVITGVQPDDSNGSAETTDPTGISNTEVITVVTTAVITAGNLAILLGTVKIVSRSTTNRETDTIIVPETTSMPPTTTTHITAAETMEIGRIEIKETLSVITAAVMEDVTIIDGIKEVSSVTTVAVTEEMKIEIDGIDSKEISLAKTTAATGDILITDGLTIKETSSVHSAT